MLLRILLSWVIMTSVVSAVDWQPSLTSAHHLEWARHASILQLRTVGHDPYLQGILLTALSNDDQVLEFEYLSTTGISDFSVVVGPPINESNRIPLPSVPVAEGWQTYTVNLAQRAEQAIRKGASLLRFDFGNLPDRRIQLRHVKLRSQTAAELEVFAAEEQKRVRQRDRARRIQQYLADASPQWISSVAVEVDRIAITIDSSLRQDALELYEYRPYEDVLAPGVQVDFETIQRGAETVLTVPRMRGDDDRVTSAWRIKNADTGRWGKRYFATSIHCQTTDHSTERLVPASQKGLSGLSSRGPRSDFVDLGVRSVTINISLNGFVTPNDGPKRTRIATAGAPLYFDPAPFAHYDHDIAFARQHQMVVSAILLIPSPRKQSHRSVLVHPDNEGGTYAMPDMTTDRGVAAYSYVLDQIARRYRDPQHAPGGISNWIAHNEIDFHTVWTNMGLQPPEIVTETYYRSMRLIDSIARQHNPHARVFVSLTHHWNVTDQGNWRRLSPRTMIETLQRYSQTEGDFDWGVAYHPYPQDLFAKVAWDDKQVSDDFDSPLVTMQNLQVLGQFLQQPAMRKRGGPQRGVILSEQGYHSHSYQAEDQDAQAAALAWAMKRVQTMPWIESFIYHRWIDHPHEGGLMLGLRTLPTKEHPSGQRKRSWSVYQAIGTDQEAAVTQGLPLP